MNAREIRIMDLFEFIVADGLHTGYITSINTVPETSYNGPFHDMRKAAQIGFNLLDESLKDKIKSWPECVTTIEGVKPIPLTEEWLKRFDFTFNELYTGNWYSKRDLVIQCKNINMVLIGVNGGLGGSTAFHQVKVAYVHQLQNLYCALTGTELT